MENGKTAKIKDDEGIDISNKLEWFGKIKGRIPDEIIKQFVEVENKNMDEFKIRYVYRKS